MIRYINKNYGDRVELRYTTPSEYLNALVEANVTWPVRYDDMFPYADIPDDYWTGYFTSRPNAKRQVRDGQAKLLASNKLFALKAIYQKSSDEDITNILLAKEKMLDAMGVY